MFRQQKTSNRSFRTAISKIPSEWDRFLAGLKDTEFSELVLMTKNLLKESIVTIAKDLRKEEN